MIPKAIRPRLHKPFRVRAMALQIGDPAPDFTLPDHDGNPVSLASFQGQRVVIYF